MPRLMAWIYDPFMRATEEACLRQWRAELLAGLVGDVLELGAGTGANLPFYPAPGPPLGRLVLAEPDRHMRARLHQRLHELGRADAEVCDADASALPFADGSFDVVVSTLVLCSVPDQARALAEARRVLRPGGRLVFLEHVASDRPDRLAWQRRLEPLWKRVAGNCHLTRDTAAAIRAAGFTVERIERQSARRALPIVRPTVRGVAVRA